MSKVFFLLPFAFIFFINTAYADKKCGARDDPWTEFIPDSLSAGVLCSFVSGGITVLSSNKSADFNPPCKAHDICYWTIGKSKVGCDDVFYSGLKSACKDAYDGPLDGPAKNCCLGFAKAYDVAVRNLAQDSYDDGQEDAFIIVEMLRQSTGYSADDTLYSMIATYCYHNVFGADCMHGSVAHIIDEIVGLIESTYLRYLNENVSEGEFKLMLKTYWDNGSQIASVESLIFERHGRKIVDSQIMLLAGLEATKEESSMLLGVLQNFGFESLRNQILIHFAERIVTKMFMDVTGNEIPPLWSMFYEQLLIQTQDKDYVMQHIQSIHWQDSADIDREIASSRRRNL